MTALLHGSAVPANAQNALVRPAAAEQAAVEAPPRKIDDILELMETLLGPAVRRWKRNREIVSSAPPATDDPSVLADYHSRRATAFGVLGELVQRRHHLSEVVRLLRSTQSRDARKYHAALTQLARVNFVMGNLREAIERQRNVVRTDRRPGAFVPLVQMLIVSGQIESAIEVQREALRRIERIRWRRGDSLGPVVQHRLESVEANLQYMLLQNLGRWSEAEPYVKKSLALLEQRIGRRAGTVRARIQLTRRLSQNYLAQARLPEAEIAARRAVTLALKNFGADHQIAASALRDLARILLASGRLDDAELLLRRSFDTFRTVGLPEYSPAFAEIRFDLADIKASRGEWSAAFEQYANARRELGKNQNQFRALTERFAVYSLVLIHSGRPDEAIGLLTPSIEKDLDIFGSGFARTGEKIGFLAMAQAAKGNDGDALESYRKAVEILTSDSATDGANSSTMTKLNWRIRTIMEAYIALLIKLRGDRDAFSDEMEAVSEAFRIGDALRSQSVQSAMRSSGVRAAAGNSMLARLIRLEQDLARQLGALSEILLNLVSMPFGQRNPIALSETRERLSALQTKRNTILDKVSDEFPDYAQLIRPKTMDIAATQSLLKPGEALISIFVLKERTLIWAIPKSGETSFAVAAIGRDGISETVRAVLASIEPDAKLLGRLPDFDVAGAHTLYDTLLQPVRPGWANANELIIVADNSLRTLPFQVLVTRAEKLPPDGDLKFSNYRKITWLARSYAITNLPSVTSLASLRPVRQSDAPRRAFFGVGDPYFNSRQAALAEKQQPRSRQIAMAARGAIDAVSADIDRLRSVNQASLEMLPRIPETGEEILEIARLLNADPDRDVLTGRRATEEALRQTDLTPYRILSFATHGLVPGDLNGLTEPALALSSPALDGTKGDGLLTTSEILGLKLNADWVVLSACNTGAANGEGAEAFSGLGRAFFYAGARSILLSNWQIHSAATMVLMRDLFRRQAGRSGLSRSEALRDATLQLIDHEGFLDKRTGKKIFSYAHPFFWAPFSIVGDSG